MKRFTLAQPMGHTSIIQKSRFETTMARVQTPQKALVWLQQQHDPNATHNCWAYRIDGQQYRFNDDGEPGGTAGKPMYLALGQLEQVVVVVKRYYGGVKLGTGGLMRAYGGAVTACLQQSQLLELVAMAKLRLEASFNMSHTLYHLCKPWPIVEEHHTATGVLLVIELPQSEVDAYTAHVTELSYGRIAVAIV